MDLTKTIARLGFYSFCLPGYSYYRYTMLVNKVAKLSIVIPCYNEQDTLGQIVREIMDIDLGTTNKELVIINDGSTDNTKKVLKGLANNYPDIRILSQKNNAGKGAALKRGIRETTGDVVVIQDADLEYDPQEFVRLLYPIERGQADVVYGSRFVGGQPHRIMYYKNQVANKFLTGLSNILTGLNLTDMETCYKMMKGDLARTLARDLTSRRFGFEPEITARIAKSNVKVYEIGISYYGRSKAEGKKISYKDGLKAIGQIVYFNLIVRSKRTNK